MLKEAMDRLIELAAPTLLTIDGRTYSSKTLSLMAPPCPQPVPVTTLTGLVHLVRAGVDNVLMDRWLMQVASPERVVLINARSDTYGRRHELVSVTLDDGQPFPFGRFLDREEFVIGLQSRFVQAGDVLTVLRIASNLEAGRTAQAEDDGIAQRTTVRQGVVLKEQVTVKGRVVLRPYRTFREVEQPASEFVFRLRSSDGGVPDCALFEADGGRWKLDAMLLIKTWLEEQVLAIPVIA